MKFTVSLCLLSLLTTPALADRDSKMPPPRDRCALAAQEAATRKALKLANEEVEEDAEQVRCYDKGAEKLSAGRYAVDVACGEDTYSFEVSTSGSGARCKASRVKKKD